MTQKDVLFKNTTVNGLNIFYREAGDLDAPTVVLLHGFPSSSHMFRTLIPILAQDFHVIAPDLPGFGFSDAPAHDTFNYTFENIAKVMSAFLDLNLIKRFALYLFDYGAPVGLRIALERPECVTALISQNGNAYLDGMSEEGWAPVRKYWENPTVENREALKMHLTTDAVKSQYFTGVKDAATRIAPEAMLLDNVLLGRPQSTEIQLDLIGDYKTNVALYPKFHEYFRKSKVYTLVVWGKNDLIFIWQGAEAFKRDNPEAKVVLYDTGHFALETHASEIGAEIRVFLNALRS